MKESKEMRKEMLNSNSKKNLQKVSTEYLKDPLQSEREVAAKTGVTKSSVNRAKQKMGQNGAKIPDIVEITKDDLEIVKLWQQEILRRFKDPKELEKIRAYEIAQINEKSDRRYMLFKGDATDKEGWLKLSDIEQLSDEELFSRLQKRWQV